MFARIKRALLNRLTTTLREYNHLYTSKDAVVSREAILKGAQLYGNVHLAEKSSIVNGALIKAFSKVSVGRYTNVSGPNTDITANIHPITIGAFNSIARNVTIQETNHPLNTATTFGIHKNVLSLGWERDAVSKGPIVIGNDVWIGTHSVVLSGVTIGDGAVVAANSVVTGDVPPYAIVGGTPAKVISYRFQQEVIAAMLDLRWWDWPIEKIQQHARFFSESVTLEAIQRVKNS